MWLRHLTSKRSAAVVANTRRKHKLSRSAVNLAESLEWHLRKVKAQHEEDLEAGYGSVYLPYALERKIPQCVAGMGVAVHLSLLAHLAGPARWVRRWTAAVAPPSCGRKRFVGCGEEGGAGIRHFKTGDVSCAAAFVCDAFAGERVRYPDCPGVVRSQGCERDDDLYPCVESTWDRGAESDGCELRKGS